MAPRVATVMRKHSSKTFLFFTPRAALRRMSQPTVRYGTRNRQNTAHLGKLAFTMPSEMRYTGTKSTAAMMIRISSFFCLLFMCFSFCAAFSSSPKRKSGKNKAYR